jgi:hypothetical protein
MNYSLQATGGSFLAEAWVWSKLAQRQAAPFRYRIMDARGEAQTPGKVVTCDIMRRG